MTVNEEIHVHETSDVTFTATDDVNGKRFVQVTDDREGTPGGLGLQDTYEGNNYQAEHAPANGYVLGVSVYDVPSGGKGGVIGTPGRIVLVTCDGAIAAGAAVQVGANGKAKSQTSTNKVVGICLSGAGSGEDAEVKLIA